MDFCNALKRHLERRERAYSRDEDGELAIAEMACDHRELLLLCQQLLEAYRYNDKKLRGELFEKLEWQLNHE